MKIRFGDTSYNVPGESMDFTRLDKPATDATLGHLWEFEGVTSLNVEGGDITDHGLTVLQFHPKLTTLNLGLCIQITDAGMKKLKHLTELTTLELWGTDITDAGLDEFAEMLQLRHLSLSFTKVTDAGLMKLLHLTWLRYLEVLSCPGITQAGLNEFMDRHPNGRLSMDPRYFQGLQAGLSPQQLMANGPYREQLVVGWRPC